MLPWESDEASRATGVCFETWINERGGSGSHEVIEGVRAILTFVERNGESRFTREGDELAKTVNRAGFSQKHDDRRIDYLVFTKVFREEILGGSKNISAITKESVRLGLLQSDSEGKSSISKSLRGFGQKRVYHVTPYNLKEGFER